MDKNELYQTFWNWNLLNVCINKDVKVSDGKHMNHLFSLYIKSMGNDTVYRVEERKYPHKPAIDFINDVLNPIEKFEKLVSEFRKELKQTQ